MRKSSLEGTLMPRRARFCGPGENTVLRELVDSAGVAGLERMCLRRMCLRRWPQGTRTAPPPPRPQPLPPSRPAGDVFLRRRFLQGIGAWGRQRSILWALLPEIVKEMSGNWVLPLATPSERGADRNLGAPVAAQLRPVAQITAAEAVAAVEPRLPGGRPTSGDPKRESVRRDERCQP